jgi:hypothetical protein
MRAGAELGDVGSASAGARGRSYRWPAGWRTCSAEAPATGEDDGDCSLVAAPWRTVGHGRLRAAALSGARRGDRRPRCSSGLREELARVTDAQSWETVGVTQQLWVPVGCAAPDGGHGSAACGSALHLDDGADGAPTSPRMEEGDALGQRRSELAPFIPACAR